MHPSQLHFQLNPMQFNSIQFNSIHSNKDKIVNGAVAEELARLMESKASDADRHGGAAKAEEARGI